MSSDKTLYRKARSKSVTSACKRHLRDIEDDIFDDAFSVASKRLDTSQKTHCTQNVVELQYQANRSITSESNTTDYDECSAADHHPREGRDCSSANNSEVSHRSASYNAASSDNDTCSDNSYHPVDSSDNVSCTGTPPRKSVKDKLVQWQLRHNIRQNAMSDLLKILSPYHDLPNDARTLLSTRSCVNIRPMNDVYGRSGEYVYIGLQSQMIKVLEVAPVPVDGTNVIELLFNIDGLPLYRSSAKQFWPILCTLTVGENVSKPFTVSIFCGNSKPATAYIFLKEFLAELGKVNDSGVTFHGHQLTVKIKGFVCDAPARAFIKCIKGHGGYYGCERCEQKGVRVDRRIVFPEIDAARRTDDAFVDQKQEQHHKPGVRSPLLLLNIGLISHVPLEYMHLICLGAMRRMLLHWLRGDRRVKLSMQIVDVISSDILQLANHVCVEFPRKLRSLAEIDRWKAVEFRFFLCYMGPVVLRKLLQSDLYHHFMLLHVAVSILVNPEKCHTHCDEADKLLTKFVQEMPKFYGDSSAIYTMHSLVHVCDDVKRHGALDTFSAFPFENALGELKRLLRGGNMPLQQVCRRLSELGNTVYRFNKNVTFSPSFIGLHTSGPCLGLPGCQYKHVDYGGFRYSAGTGKDAFVMLETGKLAVIDNIVDSTTDGVIIVGRLYQSQKIFYSYPCTSDSLGVYKVGQPSEDYDTFQLSSLRTKYMLFPRRNYAVALPLLHGPSV